VRVSITIGKNSEGYFDGVQFTSQLRETIEAFEEMHPNCQGQFVFDNSTIHQHLASNALIVTNMTLNGGGKNVSTSMKNGWYFEEGERIEQPMIARNKERGLRTILDERDLFDERKN
jgi:hypothetical protein